MQVTIYIDDALFKQALAFAEPDIDKPIELIQEALAVYIRVKTAHRLAALGGAKPDMEDIPRCRGDFFKI